MTNQITINEIKKQLSKMTKEQIISSFLDWTLSTERKLFEATNSFLMDSERITSEHALYNVSLYRNYYYKKLLKLAKMKPSERSKVKKYNFGYCMENLIKHIEKHQLEQIEQMTLPFEETQMQVLKAKGELKVL